MDSIDSSVTRAKLVNLSELIRLMCLCSVVIFDVLVLANRFAVSEGLLFGLPLPNGLPLLFQCQWGYEFYVTFWGRVELTHPRTLTVLVLRCALFIFWRYL